MLATPAADLADVQKQMPAAFVVEDKFDGIRAQAHIAPEPASVSTLSKIYHPELIQSRSKEQSSGSASLHGVVVNGVRALFRVPWTR